MSNLSLINWNPKLEKTLQKQKKNRCINKHKERIREKLYNFNINSKYLSSICDKWFNNSDCIYINLSKDIQQ